MSYQQVTEKERYLIAKLRGQGRSIIQIAWTLGRHKSSIYRELTRNKDRRLCYRLERACEMARARRYKTRRHSHFNQEQWDRVIQLLKNDWSPEQISLVLDLFGILRISHETIYRRIWKDKKNGGNLYVHLRQSSKRRRKRYRTYDSRGVLKGKRHITKRPLTAENRTEKGHFEIDLVHGRVGNECIMTLVDRKTRFLIISKLRDKTTKKVNDKLIPLILKFRIKTLTADNGTEFHGYQEVEQKTKVKFYFATPYHSWEKGTIENTNGLIRQYFPKSMSMVGLTQWECRAVSNKLNRRPRKILNLSTPEAAYAGLPIWLHL
jgi:IS30 family transposase